METIDDDIGSRTACAKRVERNARQMEERVCAVLYDMLTSGEVPSFYSVATRSQIARSTLYRKARLRSLIERAREKAFEARSSGMIIQEYGVGRTLSVEAELWRLLKKLARRTNALKGYSGPSEWEYSIIPI